MLLPKPKSTFELHTPAYRPLACARVSDLQGWIVLGLGDATGAVVAEHASLGLEAEIVIEVDGMGQRGTGEQAACDEVA